MNITTRFSSVSIIIALAILSVGAFFVSAPLAYADPTPTTLTLTDPNGGEIWSDTHAITWTSTGGVPGDLVSLVYTTNDFVTQSLIVENLPYTAETYAWDTNTVPDGTTYKVKVVSNNGLVFDPSNAVFTVDNTAPTISSVSIPDSAMKIGDTVTATITVGDDAGVTYTLVSGTIDGFALGSLTRVNSTTYTATFTVTEGGADVLAGSNIPVANLVLADTADVPNQSTAYATPISQASDPIDATRPTLTSVTIASNNSGNTNPVWAKTGDTVTVTFTSNETINTPTVTIDDNAADAVTNTTGNTWTATRVMQASDTEGVITFNIAFSDIATNAGVAVTSITSGSDVTFDRTNPSIAFTQDVEAGPVASDTVNLTVTETNGNTATYFYGFSADAVCDATDTYDVAYTSATPFVLNTEANNTKYICATAVDNASNIGYSAASTNDLNIDVTAPVISGISMPTGVYKINTTFTVTIDADANGYTKGTIVVNGVTLAGALTANGDTTYSINYTVTEDDLDVAVGAVPTASVTLIDSVLNENVAFTTVTESGGDVVIDAHRPTLSSVTITSNNASTTWAKTGDIVTLSFTGNEALAEGADEPVVTIAGHAIPAVDVVGSGTTWTAAYTMTGTDTEGTVAFTIDFKDVALNTGTPVTTITSGSNVTFDRTAPSAPSITSIAGDNYINDSEKAAVHVVGTAEANSTVSVTLTNGATAGPTSGSADGSGNFDITLDTTAVSDGTVTPSVTATDAAGNTSAADTTPTAIKDVAPPVVSTITTTDADFDGEVDTAVIVFDNPVKDSTFVASDFSIGGAAGTGFTAGTADDNTIIVTHGGVAGTEAKDVTYTVGTATDLAGNPLAAVITAGITEIDGAGPVLLSARTVDTTHVTATFSEDLDGATVNGSGNEFTVAGYAVSAASETAAGVVTLTVATMPTDATPLVTYTSNGPLNDLAAIPNTAVTPGSATAVDGVAPTLSAVHIASNNAKHPTTLAKEGDTVTLTFTSSEAIDAPSVVIGNESAGSVTNVGNNWTATLLMDGDDPQGALAFTVNFQDQAIPTPNVGTQVSATGDASSILYDRTVPSVDAGTTPKYINIAVSSINQDATVTDGGSGVDAAEFQWTQTSGPLGGATATLDTTEDTVLTATIDGTYTMELYGEDNAGNGATDTMTLVRDTVSPFVKTYSPTTGKVNVPVAAGTATVTFNETIGVLDASGASIVKDSDDSSVDDGAASVSGGDDATAVLELPYVILDTGTTYRMNVNPNAVRDTAGNPFILSFANHFTTEADVTAPVIESFTAGTITTTGAVLSATTDENATCYFSDVDEVFSSMTVFGTTGTTAHSTTLIGLTPATTYDFYARCVDASPAANAMTISAHVSFTTAPDLDVTPPAAPVITTANATIDASTYTIAGTEANDGGTRTVNLYNGATLVATLSLPAGQTSWATNVSLTQTSANVFTATATDEAGNVSAVSNTVTITEATATGDTDAPATPAISGSDETVDADTYNLSGTAGADLPSDGDRTITVYRNGTVVGSLSLPAGQTDWAFVAPLLQSTVNSFTAYSTDIAGNTSAVSNTRAIDEQQSDITGPNAISSDPADSDIDVAVDSSIFIEFDEPLDPTSVTTSSVELFDFFDNPVDADVSLANGNATVVITPWSDLDYLTEYYVEITAGVTDTSGNAATAASAFTTFTTEDVPPDTTAPIITNIRTMAPIGTDSVTITWDTDEASDSQVEYGTDASYGSTTVVDPTMTTSHSVTVTGLTPDTVYHFRVLSVDANTNSAASGDNVFQTDIDDSTAVLQVTGIDAVNTFASDTNDFADGWSWTFNVTVPTSEVEFAMKFSDFVSGANTIPAAANIRYYTAQSTEADTTAEAVTVAGADAYPGSITLDSDLDPDTAGRQIEVTVETKVPVGSAGGSYSASYGAKSDTVVF